MSVTSAYMYTVGDLTKMFEGLQKAQVPPRFTHSFLQTLGFKSTNDKIEALWGEWPEGSTSLVSQKRDEPRLTSILKRGNFLKPGDPVQPGVPAFLHPLPKDADGSRLTLAKWLVDKNAPTTARAIVNRVWQTYFGNGLVTSPEEFGKQGELPTHPELLDWLASELVARGQSLKAMHRLILLSSAYRMSSAADERALAADPLNDLFWRFDRRRLTAEEVRDSMLAAAGVRELELGGPSVYPPLPAEVLATASRPNEAWGESTPEQACRRSLYVHVKRSLPHPLLASFDRADTDSSISPCEAVTSRSRSKSSWVSTPMLVCGSRPRSSARSQAHAT